VNPVDLGRMVGAFAVTLGVAVVWLLMTYPIRPLRRSPRLHYGIAMGLAALVPVVSLDRLTATSITAAVFAVGVLWWQMRRASRKLGRNIRPDTA
jgi:hypothetical protein